MRRKWALVTAAAALVLFGAAAARADSETEWDETRRRPPVDRPGEYRTNTLDTWMSLEPMVGGFLPDGGWKLHPSPMWGGGFTIEPAEVLEFRLEATTNLPFNSYKDMGARKTPRFRFTDATSGDTFDFGRDDILGKIARFSVSTGLVNPELMTEGGGVRLIPMVGIGAYYLWDYDGSIGGSSSSGGNARFRVEFDDAWVIFVAPEIRIELCPSESFHLGLDLRASLPVYIWGEAVGNMDEKKLVLGEHVAWEPFLWFGWRF
jgi:hypothetical protein